MRNVPEIIKKLVERFERDIDSLKSVAYNETELRADFVNPFWKALGWDMTNEKGYAMQYRDVKQEYPLKTGLTTEAPDYCFTIAGNPKFFLETKKPSVDVKHAIHPAYQLRRYGWSGKLPLSILTDFEEMAVYDCRIRPEKNDKPSQARIKLYTFTDYIDLWDEISGIFSREAILKGSFDKFADTTKGKRGTSEVDSEFLKEIEIWRDKLARNIALRNSRITVRELNFAVQATIDRIIFLRMAEDRGIEEYSQLQALCSRDNIYKYLLEIFYRADSKYNSGLFHFTAEKDRLEFDNLTPKLKIDDKVLNEILSRLYYPESPYEFSFMPTEILGNVYEQFLGKVIHLTKGHQAKIEEKPEVKKAGGVYYTPEYIVEYIVANTVGKLCENKTPKDISDLRILDPACGSGSFLIGAYRFLLDYHLKWYLTEMEQKGKIPTQPETSQSGKKAKRQPAIYQGQDGEWYLSTSEKKRILLNNIYGVDIDSQAVEVTKLSLLLKVLENENRATLLQQIALFKERALPDLSDNIKCGNSLIGSDFYDSDGQTMLFDEEEKYRINAFDWDVEFPEIFKRKNKGFDAVIGNPPWGADFSEEELNYHRNKNQEIIVRMIDSFMYFVFQGSMKLTHYGYFGMIIPDVILYQIDNNKLRTFILNTFDINVIINMGNVFHKVTRPACILILNNNKTNNNVINICDLSQMSKTDKQLFLINGNKFKQVKQDILFKVPGNQFITEEPSNYIIWHRITKLPCNRLADLIDDDGIQRGVSPDLKAAFLINSSTAHQVNLEKSKLRRVLTGGKHVRRYHIEYPDLWLIYTTRADNFSKLPNICAFIEQFKDEITCKEVKQHKHPLFSLHRPREEHIFIKTEKIIGVITGDRIIVALDKTQVFTTDGLYLFNVKSAIDSRYLMAILNSRFFVFIYRLLTTEHNRVLAQVKPTILDNLPIRAIDFDNPTDKALHDRMVQLVETMLDLHKRLPNANAPHDKQTLQRQIDTTDRQIDKLVYELYGLTEEEIKVVEGSV